MHSLAKFIYFKVLGWKLIGNFPNIKKCVIIVVPHTHWIDFLLGLLIRKVLNIEINYIGKKSLFKAPHGWFFRWTGGTPVNRTKSENLVEAVINIFKERDVFRFALAPEGTRKKVSKLKTGFYFIAKGAQVPIVKVAFDFGRKQVVIDSEFYTTDNLESDFKKIEKFYEGVKGYVADYSF